MENVVTGNAPEAASETRGWLVGHFMPGEANPLRTEAVELKWFTHPKGDTRPEWSPGAPVRTLNMLLHGRFTLRFPDGDVTIANEGDFVLFGPDVAHSYIAEEESLVLTVRWPSLP